MTYLEFLSLLVLYMAWVMLLVRMIIAEDRDDPREGGRR